MKLSDKTLKVLQNFSTINSNLVIEPGQEIRTRNEEKSIAARYRADETFDKEIALFSLNELLSVYSIFDGPEIELEDKCMRIRDKMGTQRIWYFNKNSLTWADKIPPELDYNCEFEMSHEVLTRLKQAIKANGFEYLAFNSTGGRLSIIAGDLNKDTKEFSPESNLYTVDTEIDTAEDFNVVLSTADLMMLVDNYTVGIYFRDNAKLIHFRNPKIDYWISIQKFSKFG